MIGNYKEITKKAHASCCRCVFLDNLGVCRNPESEISYVSFGSKACDLFEETGKIINKMAEKKICKTCGRELPLEDFAKNRWGYMNICKECMRKKNSLSHLKTKSGDKPDAVVPSPRAEEIPPLENYLSAVSEEELFQELRRRGFKGELTISQSFNI